MKVRMLLVGLLMISAGPLGARERLSMWVSPAFAFAPANLVVRTAIPVDESNRAIEIVAESEEFYRSSEIQLDGEHAPRTTTFEFRSLPTGFYQVHAILKGPDGDALAHAQTMVNVFESATRGR